MNPGRQLRTERLILRPWRAEDREPFAAMNADPEVREFFETGPIPAEASNAQADEIERVFQEFGFGEWAVEIPNEASFIGIVGIVPVTFKAHFTPAVEVGWRLARCYWGYGYATEAARAALTFGFGTGMVEIVSLTAAINVRSRRVMEKLAMTHDCADDFDHPSISAGDRLGPHVLYRMKRDDWFSGHIQAPRALGSRPA